MWDDVYIDKSTQMHGGQGLFAKWDLEPGLMFPIAGCRAPSNLENKSHAYAITTSEGKVVINGSPDLYPHGGIGSFRLAVAIMANETVTADRAPNCQLYNDYLVVFRTSSAEGSTPVERAASRCCTVKGISSSDSDMSSPVNRWIQCQTAARFFL